MREVAIVAVIVIGCGSAAQRAPHAPNARPALSIPVHRYHLKNGMTAVLVPDPVATMDTILVRYNVGAVDDPKGQEGVAHLAAHLMSDQRPGGTSLATQLERVAIQLEVEPRPTWTGFIARFAPEHLESVVKLEAARMSLRCDRIDDPAFQAEREDVAAELSTHDSWRLNRLVGEAIYAGDDPMRRAYAADAASVRALTRTQTCGFIDRRYGPGNATIVVTGPNAPADFEHALAQLADLPSQNLEQPAKMRDRLSDAAPVTIPADVPEPILAVAFPLPTDVGERARALLLLDRVANTIHAGEFGDDRTMVLWLGLGTLTVESKRRDLATALSGSVDALAERIPPQARTGRLPIKKRTPEFEARSPTESFARVQEQHLTEDLARLDNAVARVLMIAEGTDLDAVLAAHSTLDGKRLRHTIATTLDVSNGKPIVLTPDGTRPPTRTANLIEPRHMLRRALELDAASVNVQPQLPASGLAHAKAMRLANGLSVVLAPSSSLPIANVRLVIHAGKSASPLVRIANTAIAALQSSVSRSSSDPNLALFWTVSWDSVELSFDSPVAELDHRLEALRGLADASRTFADSATKSLPRARSARTANDGEANRDDAFRALVYGDHAYGTPRLSATPDRIPTAADVEQFYQAFLQPDNATLIVTGGIAIEPVEQAIHRTLDAWRGSAKPLRIANASARRGGAIAIAEATPSIELRLGWLGNGAGDDDATRSIIAEMIDRMSPRAHCTYVAHRFGGHYAVVGTFEPRTAAVEIARLRAAISALGDSSAASKELFAVARRAVAIRAVAGPVSSREWAAELLDNAQLGRDLPSRAGQGERVAGTSYEAVTRLSNAELAANAAAWVISGPPNVVADIFGQLGITPEVR